jgi:hypothetical protein
MIPPRPGSFRWLDGLALVGLIGLLTLVQVLRNA